jgi:hypothetical protein
MSAPAVGNETGVETTLIGKSETGNKKCMLSLTNLSAALYRENLLKIGRPLKYVEQLNTEVPQLILAGVGYYERVRSYAYRNSDS